MTHTQRRNVAIAVTAIVVATVVAIFLWPKPASAATKIDIPFPPKIERPVWVPSYVNGKDSWPVSLVFAPFVIVMSAVATAIEAPFTEAPAKNLRKTAAVMTIDAVRGYRKYKATKPQPKAVSCTVRGNWVGAPCN